MAWDSKRCGQVDRYRTILREFKRIESFVGWLIERDENNFPLKEDREDSSDFIDAISVGLKAGTESPNGVYVGKIICNGQCEAVWQVNNPELAADYLDRVIESGTYPKGGIEYDIEGDLAWEGIRFYLQNFE